MLKIDDYLVDVLMPDLVGHDRRPACFLVYFWLTAEQQRRNAAVQVSYQEIAESVGVSKSSAQSAIGWLARRKLIAVSKQNVTAMPKYRVLNPWRQVEQGRAAKENGSYGDSPLRAGTSI